MEDLRDAIDILEDNKTEILNSSSPVEVVKTLLIKEKEYTKQYAKNVFNEFATKYNIPESLREFNNNPEGIYRQVTIVDILEENAKYILDSKYPASRGSKLLVSTLGYSFAHAKRVFESLRKSILLN